MPPRTKPADEAATEEGTRPTHATQERVTEGQVPVLERPTYAPIKEEERVKLNLWQKRARIIDEIGNVPKRGYNAFHKYHYALEADVTAYLGPLLAKYMIVIDVGVSRSEERVTADGVIVTVRPGIERVTMGEEGKSKMSLTRLPLNITVINADKPEEKVEVLWYGEGADTGDKGIYKAYTGALKFFYMKWFLIATGDDPEAFERVDQLAAGGSAAGTVRVEGSTARRPAKGGRQAEVTDVQIRSLAAMSRALHLGGEDADDTARVLHTAMLVDAELETDFVTELSDLEGDAIRAKLVEVLKAKLTGEQMGKVIYKMNQMAKETDEAKAAVEAKAGGDAAEDEAAAGEGYGG